MARHTGPQAFKRSPAYPFWSFTWAVVLAVLGFSSISSGRTVYLAVTLGVAFCFAVNGVWSLMVPYVRVDARGLTTYPAIVSPPRTIAWSEVKHVRSKATAGRLYLLDKDFQGISVRIKSVTTRDRGPLMQEVGLRSGRRLLPMPAKTGGGMFSALRKSH